MPFATSAQLQSAVADYLVRSDLTSQISDGVTLCESRIHYGAGGNFPSPALRIRAMERSVPLIIGALQTGDDSTGSANAQAVALSGFTLSLGAQVQFVVGSGLNNTGAVTLDINTTGATSVVTAPDLSPLSGGELVAGMTACVYYDGTRYILSSGTRGIPLPSNYLAMRRLFLEADPIIAPGFLPPDDFWARWSGTYTGRPVNYTIEADSLILGPAPDTAYIGRFLYWQKFTSIQTGSGTNWLLTNKPDVYLYGTLLEMEPYLMNDPRLAEWHALYLSATDGLQKQDRLDRFNAAPLQVRPDVNPLPLVRHDRQA